MMQATNQLNFGLALNSTVRKLKQEVASDSTISDNERILIDSAEDDISRTDNVIVERIAVRTGNAMIDQYEPYYWGCAFVFFTYNCGYPDMPAFAHKKRFRRAAGGPRIETGGWVRTMSRERLFFWIRVVELYVSFIAEFESVVICLRTQEWERDRC